MVDYFKVAVVVTGRRRKNGMEKYEKDCGKNEKKLTEQKSNGSKVEL